MEHRDWQNRSISRRDRQPGGTSYGEAVWLQCLVTNVLHEIGEFAPESAPQLQAPARSLERLRPHPPAADEVDGSNPAHLIRHHTHLRSASTIDVRANTTPERSCPDKRDFRKVGIGGKASWR